MKIVPYQFLTLSILLCFCTSVFSQGSDQRALFCSETRNKVLEKLPALKTNLININDSLIAIELASSEYNNCVSKSLSTNLTKKRCVKFKTTYERMIEDHSQIVERNEKGQKEFLELAKKYTNKHCPI